MRGSFHYSLEYVEGISILMDLSNTQLLSLLLIILNCQSCIALPLHRSRTKANLFQHLPIDFHA